MPVTLPPISRRRFLRQVLGAAGAAAVVPDALWAAVGTTTRAAVDPNRLALLSDTHLPADRATRHKTGVSMWDNCAQACREILAMTPRPAAALVNGDCAYLRGLPADYETVLAGLAPLREFGLPVHLLLGNHDDRANVLAALPDTASRVANAAERYVDVLRLPNADVYLLDSLEAVNSTPGLLGAPQLAWLAELLDKAGGDRPALVMLHHQPDARPPEKVSGLRDTAAFLDVVRPRKQVKAVFFGHTHRWTHAAEDGLHMVNLPSTAYVFLEGQPSGWVDAHVGKKGMTLQLHAISPEHPKDKEKLELAWR